MSQSTNSSESDSTEKKTTIAVSIPVRDELFSRKNPTESYDVVLRRELELELDDEEN